jgi:Family of unknown function (DUF6174)
MRRSASAILGAAVAVAVAAGCGADHSKLDDAQQMWDQADVPSYRLAVSQTCFCPPDFRRTSTSVVRDGKVASRTGETLPGTVEQLFDEARDAIDHADSADITYDDRYGYPATIKVDRDKGTTDDEYTLQVTRFTPLDRPA